MGGWCIFSYFHDMIWVMHIFISSSPVALPKPLFPHLLKILVKLGLFWLFRTFVLFMVLLGLWLLFLNFWKLLPLFHKLALHLLQLKPLLRRRPQIVKSIFLKTVVATSTSLQAYLGQKECSKKVLSPQLVSSAHRQGWEVVEPLSLSNRPGDEKYFLSQQHCSY